MADQNQEQVQKENDLYAQKTVLGTEAVHAPKLTFDDRPVAEPVMTPDQDKVVPKAVLTPEEQRQVDAFVEKIDISNASAVMNYGAGTQKNLADFSEKAMESVRTKDMGEVGEMLSDLITELKNFDVDTEEKGIIGFFKKQKNSLDKLRARYSKVETNVDAVTNELEKHEVTLMKDSDILDRMYDMNLAYYKELTMYIEAGKKKLAIVRSTDLPAAQKKAEASGLPEDAQAAKDLASQCTRFEKKIYDLELTKTIALQTAPQIRLLQGSDMQMAEKIQSTIVNTIPLWKNQMVIAIGMEHANEAARAERAVNDTTNELLKKNADKLHTVTVESAKENERGIVDVETLQHTNQELISAIDEIMQIQKDGKEKRANAEKQLSGIEQQLHDKLLEASKS
jgi:uncharacterized protein YaaN involved in tellurite resistance